MNPKKYITDSEKVLYSFYGSTRLLSLQILGILILFSGLTYFYYLIFDYWIGAASVGVYVLFHVLFLYFNTWHFVTNKKVYKRTGYVWKKVVEAEFKDIADVRVSQNLFGKLFGMGTVDFNTSGSNKVEIIYNHVNKPFEAKRIIANIMDSN